MRRTAARFPQQSLCYAGSIRISLGCTCPLSRACCRCCCHHCYYCYYYLPGFLFYLLLIIQSHLCRTRLPYTGSANFSSLSTYTRYPEFHSRREDICKPTRDEVRRDAPAALDSCVEPPYVIMTVPQSPRARALPRASNTQSPSVKNMLTTILSSPNRQHRLR